MHGAKSLINALNLTVASSHGVFGIACTMNRKKTFACSMFVVFMYCKRQAVFKLHSKLIFVMVLGSQGMLLLKKIRKTSTTQ